MFRVPVISRDSDIVTSTSQTKRPVDQEKRVLEQESEYIEPKNRQRPAYVLGEWHQTLWRHSDAVDFAVKIPN